MFFALIFGFIAGALLVIILDIIAVWYWLRLRPNEDPKLVPKHVKVKHPKDLSDFCKTEGAAPSESCMFLNLMISFLWREWRDTTSTKSYFIKKMNLEFQELLLNKAAGKLLQRIQVKDYCLGDSLPTIKKATVMKIQSRNPDEVAQELDLALEIEYSGGFLISLDVDLIFGKTAYLAVKLNSLKGRLRLQFTRVPCTHWSFSFYEEPEMDIEVESQFNGKNLARLTTLIKNQIRKSVRRKHTLPRYKVRYKPFFRQQILRDGKQEIFVHNSLITVGRLTVEIMDCSRLPALPPNSQLYCIISVDNLPWKEDMPSKSSLWPVHEVMLSRTLSGSIGVTIKQSFTGQNEFHKELIVVDTISPQSPASLVDIKRGDILLSVNDIDIDSLKQAIRLIKNGGDSLLFKLQRPPSVPVIPIESREVSDAENEKDEETVSQANEDVNPDLENSFNITMCDEDSDGDDFVNIVVKELEEQIAETDVTARKILRKVSLSTKKGKSTRGNSVNFKLDNDEATEEGCNGSELVNSENTKDSGIEDARKISSSSSEQGLQGAEKRSLHVPKNNAASKQRSPSLKQKVFGSKEVKIEEKPEESDRELKSDPLEHRKIQRKNGSLRRQKILHRNDKSIDIDSDSSDTQSLKSFELDGDGGWDNISQHTLFSKEGECQNLQKTSAVSSNVDPVWNESFVFDIEKHHKFLNVCIWSKSDERYNKDILIGYSSISLMEIGLECLSTTSGKHVQSYLLTPPYSRAGVSRTSLRLQMPGLKPETCNGDVTLSLFYKPSLSGCSLPEEKLKDEAIGDVDANALKEQGNVNSSAENDEIDTQQMHDFIPTQFYFPTRCDYCQKKVWTKTAFQCRVCAMISHKKCINNAHSNTYCTRLGVRAKPPAWRSDNEAIVRPNGIIGKERVDGKEQKLQEGITQISAEQGKGNMEVRDVKVKESKMARFEKPVVSKSEKEGANAKDSKLSEDMNSRTMSLRSKSRSSPLLTRKKASSFDDTKPREHPLQRCYGSEDCLDSIASATVTAQQAGKELFSSSVADDDHAEVFRSKVRELQNEISDENQTQADILVAIGKASNADRKSKLQISLHKSEERMQALSLLMVQYETALQESCGVNGDIAR